jgi:hypothetical protein
VCALFDLAGVRSCSREVARPPRGGAAGELRHGAHIRTGIEQIPNERLSTVVWRAAGNSRDAREALQDLVYPAPRLVSAPLPLLDQNTCSTWRLVVWQSKQVSGIPLSPLPPPIVPRCRLDARVPGELLDRAHIGAGIE